MHLLKKKETVRRQLSHSPTDYLHGKFKKLRTKVKNLLKESRERYFSNLGQSLYLNPKRFWNLFKVKSKTSTIPQSVSWTIGNDTKVANNPTTIANMFNNYFSSVFTPQEDLQSNNATTTDINDTISSGSPMQSIDQLSVTESDVLRTLKSLDPDKALGPDEIPGRILKVTANQITPSLTRLFNKSLQVGVVPNEWKLANVVPVFKKGEKDRVENYRPISLLCIVSKLLERCILNHLRFYLQNIINRCQHGFTPGKSCTTQLIQVIDTIGKLLDQGERIDVVYLDMSKAFDKVNHTRMIDKLRSFGFNGGLLSWFQSYLRHRRQKVTALGSTSTSTPVTSGVPQGSILGPILFLLYVNDLPDAISSSTIATFADDTKLFQCISCEADSSLLQENLTNINNWSSSSDLMFNQSKCKVQTISRKRKPIMASYSMGNTQLDHCFQERDLGVWISSDLSWKKQVESQSTKANQILGYVKRTTKNLKSLTTRRTIYLTIVRAHLGYATQVWAPQTVEQIRKIERVQRRATKYILHLPFNSDVSYKDRLIQCNLIPLTYWHEYLDMAFFFKLINNLIHVNDTFLPKSKKSERSTRLSRNAVGTTFKEQRYRTSTYSRSYLIRSTRTWNALPKEITQNHNKSSLATFKNILKEYYYSALSLTFDPDDPRTWKTTCVKCNCVRSLLVPPSCCF